MNYGTPEPEKRAALGMLRRAIVYVWKRHDEDAAQLLTRAFLQVLYGK